MNKVLIFHLASIGDTVVALPALRLIKYAYPTAMRICLTAKHAQAKAASMEDVLSGTDLIHGYIYLNPGKSNFSNLRNTIREIKSQKIKTLIYLNEPSNFLKVLKHYFFFRACGIKKFIGMPSLLNNCDSQIKKISNKKWESISEYLVRKIGILGFVDSYDKKNFDLSLGDIDSFETNKYLEPYLKNELIGISFGSKIDLKDWGDTNWEILLDQLAKMYPQNYLLIIGSKEEYARAQKLTENWSGRRVNLCGKLSVRESAYALSKCVYYIGHDNGPMHLAAAVGLKCVAIFSSRSLPGIWFPVGNNHKILYTDIQCKGCERTKCIDKQKECINRITPQDVLNEIRALKNNE